jgi:iron complex transport system substrate-binding protein
MHEAVVTQLEANDIPVVVLYPQTVNDILDSIDLIGQATGAGAQAAALRQEMEERIEAVTDITGGLTADQIVRSCFVVWHDPLMMAGGDTLYDEIIRLAGGINIVADQSSYPAVSLELVLDANPQVMIVGVGMGSGEDLPLQFLLEEPLLEGTDARQNDRVYSIDQDVVGRAGPRIVDAIEQFAVFIHPELFD